MARFALGPQKTNLPYGPPGGVVYTTGDQQIGGNKTFTDPLSIIRAAQAGVAEPLLVARMADDPNGIFSITNATSADGQFIPLFTFTSPNNTGLAAWICAANGLIATGTNPIVDWRITAAGGAPTTRDLFTIRRGGSERVWTLGPFGNVTNTVSAQAGVSEAMGALVLSDAGASGAGFFYENTTTTDGSNQLRFRVASNLGNIAWISSQGEQDVGGNSVLRFDARIGAGAAVVNRPAMSWGNNGREDLQLSAQGTLRFLQAGQGLAYLNATNPRALNVTLVAGTITVSNPTVTAKTIINHSRKTAGGTTGEITYTVNPGVGYTINSSSALDTSTISLHLVEGP